MLIIEFPGYPKVRAILVDEPVNGVSGIIECDDKFGNFTLVKKEEWIIKLPMVSLIF